jgi:hypothetical protein
VLGLKNVIHRIIWLLTLNTSRFVLVTSAADVLASVVKAVDSQPMKAIKRRIIQSQNIM